MEEPRCFGEGRPSHSNHRGAAAATEGLSPGLSFKPLCIFSCPTAETRPSHVCIPGGNEFNYEEVARNFKWEVPERFNFSRDVIDKIAKEAGERPALW